MIKRQTNIIKKENLKGIYLKLENASEGHLETLNSRHCVWNVKASKFAINTTNPIRAIVEHLNVQPNPEKSFIPLSVGKPIEFNDTDFGKFSHIFWG